MKNSPSLPVAVDRGYELWLWLDARVEGFPSSARASVGRRVVDLSIDVMDCYVRASYSPKGSGQGQAALHCANERLCVLRLLLRGARERRYLSVAQYDFAAEKCAEIGRMTGGWLRANTPSP